MPANLISALVFIVNALTSLYLLVLLLRFWLPWLRADFRNPLAQGILKLTSPVIIPLRRIVPSFGRLDTATILVDRYKRNRKTDFIVIKPVYVRDIRSNYIELDFTGSVQPRDSDHYHTDGTHPATRPPNDTADGWIRYLSDIRHYCFGRVNEINNGIQSIRHLGPEVECCTRGQSRSNKQFLIRT